MVGNISRDKDDDGYRQLRCFVTFFNSTCYRFLSISCIVCLSIAFTNSEAINFYVLFSHFHYFSFAVFELTYKIHLVHKRLREPGQNQPSESVTRIGGERSPPDLSDLEAGDISPCDRSEPIWRPGGLTIPG